MNKYTIQARYFPTIITALPLLVFSHYYLFQLIPELHSVLVTKLYGDMSTLVVFGYFIAQASRFFSKKFLQDELFKDASHFPTTNFLLPSDPNYTDDKKAAIRKKIKDDFGIILNIDQEDQDEGVARQTIKEAVDRVRNKVKDGRLLLQHNIEYGFVRNLIGGTLISIPFSVFNVLFFLFQKNNAATGISLVLLLFYLFLWLFHKKILVYYAYNYARVLFDEYLS